MRPFKFEKLLSIKKSEKDQKQMAYEEKVKVFEEKAYDLYHALKKKEDLEKEHEINLQRGINVSQIIQYQNYLGQLEKDILKKQEVVYKAREVMYGYKEAFIEQNIEVKKYETMKEKALQKLIEEQGILESQLMDEISIQQYINRGK